MEVQITEGEHPDQEIFVPYIPEPIIQDLLSRLPVKSLLRFRSVCRSWKGIMSDLQFVKDHLQRALQNIRSQRLLFITRHRLFIESERNREIDHGDVDDGNIVAVQLDLPFNQALAAAGWGHQIIGSCNGLVCLAVNNKIHLFNPSTRESKSITFLLGYFYGISFRTPWYFIPDDDIPSNIFQLEASGFGYDSSTDDYKVVFIWDPKPVSVYSLRKNDWQSDLEFPYVYVLVDSGQATLLNGALHWLVRGRSNRGPHNLVAAFDLTTEQFWDMPVPDMFSLNPRFVLGVIRERLCLFHVGFIREYDDFWQMNVYGDSTSWTRFRISLSYMRLQPLRSGGDAEKILVESDRRLIMYDRGSNTYREVRVHGFSTRFQFEAMTYLDTLVSPNTY